MDNKTIFILAANCPVTSPVCYCYIIGKTKAHCIHAILYHKPVICLNCAIVQWLLKKQRQANIQGNYPDSMAQGRKNVNNEELPIGNCADDVIYDLIYNVA